MLYFFFLPWSGSYVYPFVCAVQFLIEQQAEFLPSRVTFIWPCKTAQEIGAMLTNYDQDKKIRQDVIKWLIPTFRLNHRQKELQDIFVEF